jgi:hypothetical protein
MLACNRKLPIERSLHENSQDHFHSSFCRMKEYEGMKGLVEDARRYARQTSQTAMLVVGAGLV